MHDMLICHLCKAETSIVATFRFQHGGTDSNNTVMFSGTLGMHTDSKDTILQTFFAVKSVSIFLSFYSELNLNCLVNTPVV